GRSAVADTTSAWAASYRGLALVGWPGGGVGAGNSAMACDLELPLPRRSCHQIDRIGLGGPSTAVSDLRTAPGLAGPAWPPREREAWPDQTKIIDEQHRA